MSKKKVQAPPQAIPATLPKMASHHKDELQSLTVKSVNFDLWAKAILFVFFIGFVGWQLGTLFHFLHHKELSYYDPLSSQTLNTYIKYSLGFNSALTLVLGYWFSAHGGFSKLIHKITDSIMKKK